MRFAALIVIFAVWSCCAVQSARGQDCKDMEYGHENQIDPKTIEVGQLTGRAIDARGSPIPHFCVGLFTESEHKLVRYVTADDNGSFTLDTKDLPDGEYRLVGRADGLCPANQRLRVKPHSHRTKTLVAHMIVRGIDICSYFASDNRTTGS